MRVFTPSDPHDKHKSQIELMNWEADLKEKKDRAKRESRRFWFTAICSAIAAVAAVAGVLLQLILAQ